MVADGVPRATVRALFRAPAAGAWNVEPRPLPWRLAAFVPTLPISPPPMPSSSKSSPKKVAKPAAGKSAGKPAAKAPAKPSAGKAPAKPAKAPAAKPAAKPVAKPAAKAPTAKPVAKPAPKPAAAKAPVAKPAKSAPKSKPEAKAKTIIRKKPVAADKPASVRRSTPSKGVAAKPSPASNKPTTPKNAGKGPLLPIRPKQPVEDWTPEPEIPMNAFIKKQKTKLLELKDSLVDSVSGMANETLRARAEGSEASAFGMHQADAGSDAYDRDFALSLLSKEQDALWEIEEALKRIEAGTYGVCEMSGKRIPQMRLEALPFARFTVECQSEYEREMAANGGRRPVRSLFGLMDSEDDDEEDEEGGKETVEKSDD